MALTAVILSLISGFPLNLNNLGPISQHKNEISFSTASAASGVSIPNIMDDRGAKVYMTQYKVDKSSFKKAPEFSNVTGYINTNPIKLSDLKGKVVLIHFWTYTCINCIHTIPSLNDWYQKYADKGFMIASIHRPEFEFEKNIDSVKEAVKGFGIKYPVIQDNNYVTWNAYENSYWPRDYLVDNEGFIRYDHVGEGGYAETENMIRTLLAEPGTNSGVITNVTAID